MEPLYCILFFNAFSLQLLCSLAKLLHSLNNLYFLFQKYCVPSKNFVCLTSFYILSQKYCVPLRNVEFARSRSGTVLTWDSVAGDKCFQFFRCSQAMCRYTVLVLCSSRVLFNCTHKYGGVCCSPYYFIFKHEWNYEHACQIHVTFSSDSS